MRWREFRVHCVAVVSLKASANDAFRAGDRSQRLLEPNKSRWKCGSNYFAEVQRGNRSLSPAITRTGHLLCSSTFRKSLCSRSTVPMWPTRQLRVSVNELTASLTSKS